MPWRDMVRDAGYDPDSDEGQCMASALEQQEREAAWADQEPDIIPCPKCGAQMWETEDLCEKCKGEKMVEVKEKPKGHWWIRFRDREPACAGMCTIKEAKRLGFEAGDVIDIWPLPYPASPRLDDNDGWGEGQHPSFCHDPEHCKGKSSCPKERACDD